MSAEKQKAQNLERQICEALDTNSFDAFREALVAGADPDMKIQDMPLIYHAAVNGNVQMLDELIARGANLDATDSFGLTTTMLLALAGHQSEHMVALQRLIEAGADLSRRNPDGKTALDLAKSFSGRPQTELLKKAHAPSGRPPSRRDGGWERS